MSTENFTLEAKEMLMKYQSEFEHLNEIEAKVTQFYSQYLKAKQSQGELQQF
jgi:hypothetical protein